jgi:hypothetical protein
MTVDCVAAVARARRVDFFKVDLDFHCALEIGSWHFSADAEVLPVGPSTNSSFGDENLSFKLIRHLTYRQLFSIYATTSDHSQVSRQTL